MARLVVASRNPALPFALNSAGHEVVVVDEDSDVRWTEYVSFAEVVLLDLGDPHTCSVLIDDLAGSVMGPIRVLLLAGSSPGWQDVITQPPTPGLEILPLPLSMPRLSDALERLINGPEMPRAAREDGSSLLHVPPAPEPVPEPVAEAPEELPPPLPEPEVVALPQPEPEVVALPQPAPEPELEPAPEPAAPAATEPPPRPVVQPVPSYGGETPATITLPAATLTTEPKPRTAPLAVEGQLQPPEPRLSSLVRSLTGSLDELSTMRDTAEVILAEALSLVAATAGAVLVRDGAVWRVAAGQDLRPLEERYKLEHDHWLVRQVSDSWHGVLLSGGEGQWSELYGAPLSGRAHLLAAPLPPLGAILLLARDHEVEFSEGDLQTLTPLTEEGGHLLSAAVDVRKLARALQSFCDFED